MAAHATDAADEKSRALINNERFKLTANLLYSVAITIFAAASIIPTYSYFLTGNQAFPWLNAILIIFATMLAMVVHKRALKLNRADAGIGVAQEHGEVREVHVDDDEPGHKAVFRMAQLRVSNVRSTVALGLKKTVMNGTNPTSLGPMVTLLSPVPRLASQRPKRGDRVHAAVDGIGEAHLRQWPAAGFVDTEIGCFMKPKVAYAVTEVWA